MGTPKFSVYQDSKEEWRWSLIAGNGLVIATPGEGYSRKADVLRAIGGVMEAVEDAEIEYRQVSKRSSGVVEGASGRSYVEVPGIKGPVPDGLVRELMDGPSLTTAEEVVIMENDPEDVKKG
jgi:uncharacterized protein YegP (UPF0339 family)